MSEQLIPWAAWAGLVVLAILCLPIGTCQKFILGIVSWALRLALVAVLAAGAYLYFRPGDMPAQISNGLNDFPRILSILPDRAAPHFALCLASLIVAPLVPLLMVLDVTRALAGRRLSRIRALADGQADVVASRETSRRTVVEAVPAPLAETAPMAVPVLRPVDRRTASTTITEAASRIPVAPPVR
jgi:hypothetical protein